MCYAPESNRAEIGPIELAAKYRGKSTKGVSIYLVSLDKVALGIVLHVGSYCMELSAHAALYMVGCCMRVAAAHTVLHMVGYYTTVIACVMSHAALGMLL